MKNYGIKVWRIKYELKYEELWNKIGDLIRLITINSDKYDEKLIKIKYNSDDHLLLELYEIIMVVKYVFHKGNK